MSTDAPKDPIGVFLEAQDQLGSHVSQLTPMLVQYLVGLCCLRWDPDAVDVTIGDMVLDSAAEKERDVDVTVTVAESPDVTHAFKAADPLQIFCKGKENTNGRKEGPAVTH